MMSHVVLFAYPIKLNISTKNIVTKILPKKLHCDFRESLQCSQENNGQNFMSRASYITPYKRTYEEAQAMGLYIQVVLASLSNVLRFWATFPVSSNLKQLSLF